MVMTPCVHVYYEYINAWNPASLVITPSVFMSGMTRTASKCPAETSVSFFGSQIIEHCIGLDDSFDLSLISVFQPISSHKQVDPTNTTRDFTS